MSLSFLVSQANSSMHMHFLRNSFFICLFLIMVVAIAIALANRGSCKKNSDCKNGEFCTNLKCDKNQCYENGDCLGETVCENNQCRLPKLCDGKCPCVDNRCVECTVNDDCSVGVCDTRTFTCVQCVEDSDCPTQGDECCQGSCRDVCVRDAPDFLEGKEDGWGWSLVAALGLLIVFIGSLRGSPGLLAWFQNYGLVPSVVSILLAAILVIWGINNENEYALYAGVSLGSYGMFTLWMKGNLGKSNAKMLGELDQMTRTFVNYANNEVSNTDTKRQFKALLEALRNGKELNEENINTSAKRFLSIVRAIDVKNGEGWGTWFAKLYTSKPEDYAKPGSADGFFKGLTGYEWFEANPSDVIDKIARREYFENRTWFQKAMDKLVGVTYNKPADERPEIIV